MRERHRRLSVRALSRFVSLAFLPFRQRIACFAAFGVLLGLGLAVAHVSRVTSYMSDAPEACVNCHVMRSEYASWRHSSHASVATCNDCHVPHTTPLHAYAFKARDGLYHSSVFTLRLEPQVIRISAAAEDVVEGNCIHCHEETLSATCGTTNETCEVRCWHCHEEVPHGRVGSLSDVSPVMSPELPPVLEPQKPSIGGRRPRGDQESTQTRRP